MGHVVPELEQDLRDMIDIKEGQITLPKDMSLLNSTLKLIYKYNSELKDITINDSTEELFRG